MSASGGGLSDGSQWGDFCYCHEWMTTANFVRIFCPPCCDYTHLSQDAATVQTCTRSKNAAAGTLG